MGERFRQAAERLCNDARRLSDLRERLSRGARPLAVLASPLPVSDVVVCKWSEAPCKLAQRLRFIARRRSHQGAVLSQGSRTLPLVEASQCKDDEPLSSSARRYSKCDEARRTTSPPR